MFEPLLFHLFFLYSSLSLIDRLVKYARCLALGKIFLVGFYLFVETVCHLYVFIQTSETESSHPVPSLLPLHLMVLLSSLGVSSLEHVVKTVREKDEGRSEACRPSGMPPSYIVVKSTWLPSDPQAEQPQPDCGQSVKLIRTNQPSLEILFVKWEYLAQVRNVQFPFPPLLLVVADRKRFNKMMRILGSKEESWRRRANNSEGFLFLSLTNSLLVILFCMRADSVLLVSRERPSLSLTQELSSLKRIKCDPA